MAEAAQRLRASAPAIAVVIATRGSAEGAPGAARSVLRSSRADLELSVVDQREGSAPAALVEATRDPRARIVNAPDRGLAAARNQGVASTTAPLIAFTDDDCQADPGWLQGITAAFAQDPRIGVVFGSVRAPDYDRSTGLIQAYEVRRQRVVHGASRQWRINGIGGCMAIRRSTFEAIHGFDVHFGVGSTLRAAEDNDFLMRALAAGHWACETPQAAVTHFGFRSWREAPALVEGYMFGLGALHAKMIRLTGVSAIRPTLALAWRWAARAPAVDLNHRPPRLLRLRAFLRGLAAGWRLPLDRAVGHFARR